METQEPDLLLLDSLFRHLTDAVIALDRKGLVTLANPSAAAMTGHPQAEMVGKPLSGVLNLLAADSRKKAPIPSLRALHEDHKPVRLWNVIVLPSSGRPVPVDALFTPLREAKGALGGGCIAVLRPIADVLNKEQQAIQRYRIAAIGNITGHVAHNCGNWMEVISGHAASIADNLLPKTRAHEDALAILKAAAHATGVTKRLISIARASSLHSDLKTEPVNVATVFKHALAAMEEVFSQKKIAVKVRMPDSSLFVMAEERLLFDCVSDLLTNSAEAMPRGGTIRMDVAEKSRDGIGYLVLAIRDNGVGMSKEVAAQAVEAFFSTKPTGIGMGLGLTMVQNAVRQWEGFIKIRSQAGKGTAVRVFLRKARSQQPRDAGRDIRPAKETILVVDDQQASLDRAAALLQGAGYKPLPAGQKESPLELLTKYGADIDLALVDAVMPGVDTRKMLDALAETAPDVPVVMMSGFPRDCVRSMISRSTAGYVQKPLERENLLTVVRRVLDQREALRKA